jgi:uncharacterized lipoprotein YddW (UPF0748 family)
MPHRLRGPARGLLLAAALAALAACGDSPVAPVTPGPTPPGPTPPGPVTPGVVPDLPREFRGLWIATVANIDWPSRTGLSVGAQQAELGTLLDRAQAIGFNAVILQVRAAGDALYPSTLEPWMRSLSGTQGGDPGWDPLAFALREAHARGMELHAWFNPFRAGNLSDTLALAPLHLGRRRPELMRVHCRQLWFDPGESAVREHVLAVIADVLRRYDVDAVHLDDYFYPYPDSRCPGLSFADSAPYARYVAAGGLLARDDWRRDNVNRFVEALRPTVHAIRPTARVGISPFGIWRPGTPSGITGLDSWASIYADSQWWLSRGWVDYFAPQLYWARSSTGQNFDALLGWWASRNTQQRHLWPGLAAYRVADGTSSAFAASEIEAQVNEVRRLAGLGVAGAPRGAILYNTTSVLQNRGGLATLLEGTVFATRAAVPATPWLAAPAWNAADRAVTFARGATGFVRVRGTRPPAQVRWWLLRWRTERGWTFRQYPMAVDSVAWPRLDAGGPASDVALEFLGPNGVSQGLVRIDAP